MMLVTRLTFLVASMAAVGLPVLVAWAAAQPHPVEGPAPLRGQVAPKTSTPNPDVKVQHQAKLKPSNARRGSRESSSTRQVNRSRESGCGSTMPLTGRRAVLQTHRVSSSS